jgi:hypothetical protein
MSALLEAIREGDYEAAADAAGDDPTSFIVEAARRGLTPIPTSLPSCQSLHPS